MNRIYVLAGNYQEFLNYCREREISPNSPLIKYISDEHTLRGIQNPQVEYYGTYVYRRDFHDIKQMIYMRTNRSQSTFIFKQDQKAIKELRDVWNESIQNPNLLMPPRLMKAIEGAIQTLSKE
jgi:hypothetical protein